MSMAPTNLAYTSYLIATAYGGSFPELLGAVPAAGSTGRSASRCSREDRGILSLGAESRPTAVRSSPRWFGRSSPLPTASGPSSAQRSARAVAVTSPPPAVRVDVLGHGLSARGLADLGRAAPRRQVGSTWDRPRGLAEKASGGRAPLRLDRLGQRRRPAPGGPCRGRGSRWCAHTDCRGMSSATTSSS
jgi:hypothetical protein